jgi:hypothetical protein
MTVQDVYWFAKISIFISWILLSGAVGQIVYNVRA